MNDGPIDRTERDAGPCATAAEARTEATFTLHTEADQPDRITVDWPDGLPSMTLGREAVERMVGNINDLRAEVHRVKARVQSDDLRIAGLLTDLAEAHRAHETTRRDHETTRRELAHITAHMHREVR